jgi:hypothetical protein
MTNAYRDNKNTMTVKNIRIAKDFRFLPRKLKTI